MQTIEQSPHARLFLLFFNICSINLGIFFPVSIMRSLVKLQLNEYTVKFVFWLTLNRLQGSFCVAVLLSSVSFPKPIYSFLISLLMALKLHTDNLATLFTTVNCQTRPKLFQLIDINNELQDNWIKQNLLEKSCFIWYTRK